MDPSMMKSMAKDKLRAKNAEVERAHRFENASKALDQHWNEHSSKYGEEVANWPKAVQKKYQEDERGLRSMFLKPNEQEDFDYYTETKELNDTPMFPAKSAPKEANNTPMAPAKSAPQSAPSQGWHDPVSQPEFLRAMSKATGLPESNWKRSK